MPLENRRWFVLTSVCVSLALTYGLWTAASLPLGSSGLLVFLLATCGSLGVVNKVGALVLIRAWPMLGKIEP